MGNNRRIHSGDGTRAGLEILAGLLVIGMWGIAFVLWASILAVAA